MLGPKLHKNIGSEYFDLKKVYPKLPFINYYHDVYSQNGEDGVLVEIFSRLGLLNNDSLMHCVEFGAWDGRHFSNTFIFVEQYGWNAIYIEGDENKFSALLDTVKLFPRIKPIHAMVKPEIEDKNSLDNLLKTTNIPKQFELLSIDIDSYDLDVWENVKIYRPTVVVIEINSSIPPGIIWRNSRNTPGNTFSATIKVAQQKGYSLVCHTGNLIFIDNSVIKLLTIQDKFLENPELLFMYESEWMKFNPYAYNPTLIKRIKRRLPKWEKIFAIFTKLFSR